jgi:hypothetical protein
VWVMVLKTAQKEPHFKTLGAPFSQAILFAYSHHRTWKLSSLSLSPRPCPSSDNFPQNFIEVFRLLRTVGSQRRPHARYGAVKSRSLRRLATCYVNKSSAWTRPRHQWPNQLSKSSTRSGLVTVYRYEPRQPLVLRRPRLLPPETQNGLGR